MIRSKRTSTSNTKLIIFDVDGTLIGDDKEIKQKTISVIHRLQEKGIFISLATGKTFPSVHGLIKSLNLKEPLILAKGAIIQRPNRIMVASKFLPIDVIEKITSSDTKFEADLALYTADTIFDKKETFNIYHMKGIV